MKKSQLAAQLYTLRDYLKTAGGVDRALARVRAMGYEAVQVSGVAAPLSAVKKAADDNGLAICATHADNDALLNNPEVVVEQLDVLNCRHTAFACAEGWRLLEYDGVLEFAGLLEKAALTLGKAGISLSYHNHNMEFAKFKGEFILDLILRNAPHLYAEIDTYWVAMGGCDPAEWIKKYAEREPLLHLKDFGIRPFSSTTETVGKGNLRWETIVPAAEAAGVEWFIVEQDSCDGDPFTCLRESFDYLTGRFVR